MFLSSVLCLTAAALALVMLTVEHSRRRRRHADDAVKGLPQRPPGPKAWPIIGNMHLLGEHSNPFIAFTALSKKYGDIFSMVLGNTPCVIVNNYDLIKEVLITKGSHFGGRPDFLRYHALFGGDRNNSLALCDWSELQKTRRQVARLYCSPRFSSLHYDTLTHVAGSEVDHFLDRLSSLTAASAKTGAPATVHIKPLIQAACANIFAGYMCSTRFSYDDDAFVKIVNLFDKIFWEINQGYAVDFLPWLAPAYRQHMDTLAKWALEIRTFILTRIMDEHRRRLVEGADGELDQSMARDFTDALLIQLQEDPHLEWQHIIFELEDFLGGHSAVGNLTMLSLAAVAARPEVSARIQAEVEMVTGGCRAVSLADRPNMPYTEATILEALRVASSPIVPHVATQDTTIAGYQVDKGTMVFINNHELNTGEAYWDEPAAFRPERFLQTTKDGSTVVVKPAHFIPFSTGKRTCIGYRLVQSCSFVLLASLLQNYNVTVDPAHPVVTYTATVALPPDTFPLAFAPRATTGAVPAPA
ncbi:Cytochrome P450 307a1 [Frankliniella fusca]|uniref:Cytochrome P450 307a1 n=1 Tax=Frankliniella fusca TaxID=407009 RepID=A0AAE1LJM5_9NEOP|nr:Cytochrome P450 307a1 [Frankliniella fusca]